MNKEKITNIIIDVIEDYFKTQNINEEVTPTLALFGNESLLDSMGLVNVIIDIESRFLEEDKEVSLTSEEAMSRRNSPFRTIETLSEFIMEQLEK